jgi:P-type E1-E2 ATPase
VGDIVKIEKGFKIAADMIILESNGIKVDNSSLTGESEPQKRTPQMTDELPSRTRFTTLAPSMSIQSIYPLDPSFLTPLLSLSFSH